MKYNVGDRVLAISKSVYITNFGNKTIDQHILIINNVFNNVDDTIQLSFTETNEVVPKSPCINIYSCGNFYLEQDFIPYTENNYKLMLMYWDLGEGFKEEILKKLKLK